MGERCCCCCCWPGWKGGACAAGWDGAAGEGEGPADGGPAAGVNGAPWAAAGMLAGREAGDADAATEGDGAAAVAGEAAAPSPLVALTGFFCWLPPDWKSFWKSIARRAGGAAPAAGVAAAALPLPLFAPPNPTVFCFESAAAPAVASTEPNSAGLSPCRCSPDLGCTAGEDDSAALASFAAPNLILSSEGAEPSAAALAMLTGGLVPLLGVAVREGTCDDACDVCDDLAAAAA